MFFFICLVVKHLQNHHFYPCFLWVFRGSCPKARIWSVLIPVLVALLLGLTLFVSGVCDAIGGNEATVVITDFLFSHLTDKCDQPVGTLATWIRVNKLVRFGVFFGLID